MSVTSWLGWQAISIWLGPWMPWSCHILSGKASPWPLFRPRRIKGRLLAEMSACARCEVRIGRVDDPASYPGWWFQPLWKIWKSIGMIIPNRWGNKKCSKPPTSICSWWFWSVFSLNNFNSSIACHLQRVWDDPGFPGIPFLRLESQTLASYIIRVYVYMYIYIYTIHHIHICMRIGNLPP